MNPTAASGRDEPASPSFGNLPVDSDIEVGDTSGRGPRPVHLRWQYLALVAAGGAVGTSGRELLTRVIPAIGPIPAATVLINVAGAFLLGVLLESLARRGADEGRRRTLRLLLGTGVLGGFTTYSALATDTALLLRDNLWGPAAGYALGTVVLGALATWAGVLLAGAFRRRRVARAGSE